MMAPKKTQKCGNMGLLCLDKPVLGQGGGGGILWMPPHTETVQQPVLQPSTAVHSAG